MKKPAISPKVRAALHQALDVVLDAIEEPDAEKPKQRRTRATKGPRPLPQKPADMSDVEWRARAEAEADRSIELRRDMAKKYPRNQVWSGYASWSEDDWRVERERLIRVHVSGDRHA